MKQRDYMRYLVRKHGIENRAAIIADYAKAEDEGKVDRQRRDDPRKTAIMYAAALYADMVTKGWARS